MEHGAGRQFKSVHEIREEYSPFGYGLLKINNPDGTIRYGTYDVEMFKPPVNLREQAQVDKMKAVVKMTIGQPHFTQRQKSSQAPGPRAHPEMEPKPDSRPSTRSFEKPYIPNDMKQFDEVRFQQGNGIDFYVDGGRFLNENVTYTRCIFRAFTIDQYRVINATKGMADLDISRGRHPFYGFR